MLENVHIHIHIYIVVNSPYFMTMNHKWVPNLPGSHMIHSYSVHIPIALDNYNLFLSLKPQTITFPFSLSADALPLFTKKWKVKQSDKKRYRLPPSQVPPPSIRILFLHLPVCSCLQPVPAFVGRSPSSVLLIITPAILPTLFYSISFLLSTRSVASVEVL